MVDVSGLQQRVGQHYSQATGGDVLDAVLSTLEAAGKDTAALQYADLGSVDHFHGGALGATRSLARLGELAVGERVLDMGGGFGGPARTLAVEYGCRVTVLDPTEPFVRAGRALTNKLGLQDAVQFHLGSGLAMPFADASFDVVWTQNASMNIPDKARLADEQRRVLRRGGRLVFQEVFAGPGGRSGVSGALGSRPIHQLSGPARPGPHAVAQGWFRGASLGAAAVRPACGNARPERACSVRRLGRAWARRSRYGGCHAAQPG